MKKRSITITISIAIVLLMVSMATGCASKPTYTVTYYDADGATVLQTDTVDEGSILTPVDISKDGFNFVGFFATPQLTHEFDFSMPIKEDVSIFCGFVQDAADTREFYIVGGGTSPLLLTSNWGNVINPEHRLIKEENSNTYTITLDLYEGDEFQFALDSSWHNQRGYGYCLTNEQDGVQYIAGSGSYGEASAKRSNIKCLVSGNYTFVLTTNPSADYYDEEDENYTEENKECYNMNPYDTIEWTYNDDIEEASSGVVTTYYIKGSGITQWEDRYIDLVKMTDADGTPTLTVPLRAGEEFLFSSLITVGDESTAGAEYLRYSNFDEESALLFDSTESMNIVVKTEGVYKFTYDPKTTVLTAALEEEGLPKYDYYIKGTFGGTNWGTEFNTDHQLIEQEEASNVYILDAVSLAAGDELGISSTLPGATEAGEWGTDNYTLVSFYNINNLAPASEDNANANFVPQAEGNGNIVCQKDGLYQVIFDAYTTQLTFISAG